MSKLLPHCQNKQMLKPPPTNYSRFSRLEVGQQARPHRWLLKICPRNGKHNIIKVHSVFLINPLDAKVGDSLRQTFLFSSQQAFLTKDFVSEPDTPVSSTEKGCLIQQQKCHTGIRQLQEIYHPDIDLEGISTG